MRIKPTTASDRDRAELRYARMLVNMTDGFMQYGDARRHVNANRPYFRRLAASATRGSRKAGAYLLMYDPNDEYAGSVK